MILYKKIGQICSVLNGFAFKSENYVDSGLRIIRIVNVQKGVIEDSQPVYYPLNTPNMDKYLLYEGDLLLSLTGNVGRVAILEREFLPAALNQRVACLRIIDSVVTTKYLFHILNSAKFEKDCIQASNGVAQKNMSTEWLKQYEIPVYPVEMQERIVEVLDKIQSAIQKRRKQICDLESLVKSQFIEMFGDPERNDKGWGIVSLYQIAEYFNGLTYRPEDKDCKGIIVLRSSNIQQGELDFSDIVRVHCQIKEKLYVKAGDILMCSRNGSANLVGKVAQIRQTDEPMTFGAFMMIIRSQFPEYLTTYFRLDSFRNQIKTGATTTINQITSAMLNKVRLPLPPKAIVDKFARFVEQTDKSKNGNEMEVAA